MKEVRVDFYNAKRVLISEENDCTNTVIYAKSTENGHWIGKAVAEGINLREACMNYIESGEADLSRLNSWWEKFLKFDALKPRYKQITRGKPCKLGSTEYENAFNKWMREYLSDDLLFELLTNKETTVAVNWGTMANNESLDLGERER